MSDGNDWLGRGDEGGLDSGDLDGVLDQALGSYTAREPRVGLESRVLSAIAAAEAERGRRRGWSWKPAWALAAAMALLAVVGIPLSYRLGRQETAVVRNPEIRQSAVAEVRHAAPEAALTAPASRSTFVRRERDVAAEPEGVEIAANSGPVPMQQRTTAQIDDKPRAEEEGALKPITLKPITIAPIEISALN